MAHALIKTRTEYRVEQVKDLNSPDTIIIELDDGTVYQIGLKQNPGSDKVGLRVRLVEAPDLSAALVVRPEVSNSVVFYPAPEDI